jgi:hypothetical protein
MKLPSGKKPLPRKKRRWCNSFCVAMVHRCNAIGDALMYFTANQYLKRSN